MVLRLTWRVDISLGVTGFVQRPEQAEGHMEYACFLVPGQTHGHDLTDRFNELLFELSSQWAEFVGSEGVMVRAFVEPISIRDAAKTMNVLRAIHVGLKERRKATALKIRPS